MWEYRTQQEDKVLVADNYRAGWWTVFEGTEERGLAGIASFRDKDDAEAFAEAKRKEWQRKLLTEKELEYLKERFDAWYYRPGTDAESDWQYFYGIHRELAGKFSLYAAGYVVGKEAERRKNKTGAE
jgi:hypothetical protein